MIREIGGFELQLGEKVGGATLFSLVVQPTLLSRVISAQLVNVEAQALVARINGGEQVDGWDPPNPALLASAHLLPFLPLTRAPLQPPYSDTAIISPHQTSPLTVAIARRRHLQPRQAQIRLKQGLRVTTLLMAQKQFLEAMSHRVHVDNNMMLVGKLLFGVERSSQILQAVRLAGQPLVYDWTFLKKLVSFLLNLLVFTNLLLIIISMFV
ncbi:hypothetical protein Droror1_Dr00027827 [Drosera rotundifolia]